jgi:4-hydroxybutyrate dehydrogenase
MRSSSPAIAGVSGAGFVVKVAGGYWRHGTPTFTSFAAHQGGFSALRAAGQALMARILYLTQIDIDHGAVRLLPAECERTGMKKPLVVTDAGVRAAGVLAQALAALEGVPHAVFDGTPPNPTEAAVRAATALLKAEGCDGLIAVGGGSSIDLAKGVAIAATHDGPLATYATIEGGSPKISERALPLIAVPTTAGTGSEVARGAILIVDDGRKLGFHSWHLMPRAALLDPELTLGLPPLLTAATGMDAIAHCMETFMAHAVNPPADGIALDGLQRGWAHIERATRDGQDRDARWNMMSASMQGAMAFQKGLGCVHSLSHSLGGVNPRLHHGTLNAMFLPAVVRFNAGAESIANEDRLARMARAIGLHGCDAQGTELAEALRAMNARLGLPSGLAAMGVTRDPFEKIIDGAMADHCHKTNPRLATRDDYREMLEASM